MAAPASTATVPARALLWSPSLQGHRLVYCRVLAEMLTDLGCEVGVAADLANVPAADAPRLGALRRGPATDVIDVGVDLRADRGALAPVQRCATAFGAGLVVLTEADDLLGALAARGASAGVTPRKLVALFLRSTNHQYAPQLSLAARLRRRVRMGALAQEGPEGLHRRVGAQAREGVASLVLDELYAERHLGTHAWFPDIYRDPGDVGEGASAESESWRPRLAAFLAAARRPLFVYVGTNQHRRGYDTLLRLALAEDGCVAHCGRFVLDGEPSDSEVPAMRAALAGRSALLETGGPYLSAETAELFLRAARCVVLPYRHHDGSSGVMLQALAAGRPVLVPDRGLMAYRVNAFGLGATYRDGDDGDLRRRFRELERRGPEVFGPALETYMGHFSPPQRAAALSRAVTGHGAGARLPWPLPGAERETGGRS